MNLTQNNGFEFVEFIKIHENEIKRYSPIAGSFAVIKCEEKILMIYNKWRKQWELPAGKREEGETEKECAIRELYEETGQNIPDLDFLGLLKLKNSFNGEIKYNPVYSASVAQLQPFIENEEVTEVKLWSLEETIGVIDEIDLKLLEFI